MQKRIFIFFTGLFALAVSSTGFCQYPNVMISDIANPEEPSIYINPKNTNQILAGANINAYYYSNDGGYTWGNGYLQSTLGVWGDPCVVIDTAGYFYFFHLSAPPGGVWLDQIVCQRSTNNGLAWNNGFGIFQNLPKQQDKEWAVVNRMNNEIYVTWTQFDKYGDTTSTCQSNILFSKTSDQGYTWSPAVQINEIPGNCRDEDNTVEGAVPAIGPQGEIYTSWAGPAGLVFDRSLDGGTTWLDHDIFVSDMPGGWDFMIPGIYRCNGMPVTCCDLSNGPHRGTIYINWSDQRNGSLDTDIWLVKSTDGGDTWSAPIRVNDDGPGKQQFFTWMTIDQVTGYLWFVFYDRRAYDDNSTDVYCALSKDGGLTFTNFKVSESPFIPGSNVFFGDYNNISAHNHIVRPVWTRLNEDKLSIWTAILDSTYMQVQYDQGAPFSIEQNYPNPFNESTSLSYKLIKPSLVDLRLYDMSGTCVAVLIQNEFTPPGKYIRTLIPDQYGIAPGIYYIELIADGIPKHKKVIFTR